MSLRLWSVVLSLVLVVAHVPLVAAPGRVRRMAVWFPRSRWCGWLLAAIDLIWAAWLLNKVPLGRFDVLKDYLLVLTPVAFVVVAVFVDELLAARALGGLLVLAPALILDAARWHESGWRLVMVAIAYIMVADGMLLLLSPYWFRKVVQGAMVRDGVRRGIACLGCAAGIVLVVLGLVVY